MATRSMPIVSCRSTACAIASLVPTPSVERREDGLRISGEIELEQTGEPAESPQQFGPASAVDRGSHQFDGPFSRLDVYASRGVRRTRSRRSRARQGVLGGIAAYQLCSSGAAVDGAFDALEHVLADNLRQRDGVFAVVTGPAQPVLGLLARGDQPVERDVTQRVGADGRPDRRRRPARSRSARHARRSRCRRSTATSPAATRCGRAPR